MSKDTQAGVYSFDEMFSKSSFSDPSKGIVFVVAEPEYAI